MTRPIAALLLFVLSVPAAAQGPVTGPTTTPGSGRPAAPRSAAPLRLAPDRLPVPQDTPDSQAFLDRVAAAGPKLAETDARVEALLKQMTLEEKIGQMTNLVIDTVSTGRGADLRVDPAKLERAVVTYGVGSLQNVNPGAFPVAQWHEIIGKIQEAARRTRLKIPVLYGIDSIHGANYISEGTLFPQGTGMAATWNPELALRTAEITAAETRAAGIPWNFSPLLDVGRQALWPRLYETYGEDTYVTTVMGLGMVRGYEGTNVAARDRVASCLKHYVGYSVPVSGRDRTPALIPETTLREIFLPPFRAAVAAGAHTVMVNSGEVNGVPVHASRYLLTDVLRGELGFKGLVVSDYEDVKKLVSFHRVAADEKEATRMAVMAGIDVSMVPQDFSFVDHMLALVREGSIPESRVDEAVRHVLKLKFDLGLFESATPPASLRSEVGRRESREVALQAARESITLLKNVGGALPLAKGRKVFVTGPTAHSLLPLNNGWTFTWQGTDPSTYPTDRMTILEAIRAVAGAENVTYVPGTELERSIDVPEAAIAASAASVAVVCLGEGAYAETPGSVDDLTLPAPQLDLVTAIAATGIPVVIVLTEGRPRVITRVADSAAAILMAYNPGLEGAQAIAEVLFGDVNPSGKLPFTYPRYANALMTYDHKPYEVEGDGGRPARHAPLFAFGHGMSYTTFAYSDLKVGRKTIAAGERVPVSVTVTNTGTRPGKEAVLLFVRDMVATMTPPVKRLRRFAKVSLAPGEKRTLTFTLGPEDLSFVGPDGKWTLEPGVFTVTVGDLGDTFTVSR
jgi:beta-glucosidase